MPPTLYNVIAGFFIANILIFLSTNIFIWLDSNAAANLPGINETKMMIINETFVNFTKATNPLLASLNEAISNSAPSTSLLGITGSLAFTLAEMPKVVALLLQLPDYNKSLINALISISGLDIYIPGIHILVTLLYMFMWFVMLLFIASVLTKYNWTGG